MKDMLLHRLYTLLGIESTHLDPRHQQTFSDAFPMLDSTTSILLCKRGRTRTVFANLLVYDAADTSDRTCLLLDGSISIERPGIRDVELYPGVLWNHLTWAPRGRPGDGGRLYAGKQGATVVEWDKKRLGRLLQSNPELYKILADGVMRCVGVNYDLTLEKARFVPPASLRRSATLAELTSARMRRPIFVADNDDEYTVVGYANDIDAARQQIASVHPGGAFVIREQTKGFFAVPDSLRRVAS